MRTVIGIFIALAFVNAWDFFGKKTTTPNPAEYCKDKNETYCNIKVPKGFCESAFHTKEEIKDRCAKSCKLCCGDMYPEKCKELKKKGFCESAFHTKVEIKERCGDTCGLCNTEEDSKYYYKKVTA
ncbi:shTK domain protein [Ancylostoma caninum]|uniref:ShTK domain protein n=1 Tax=Ancylostoma caninum TaxID=29170 RepID=A0A368G4K8_ANCCA|nr:shTK domain protein [Ancylostoma caninum]